MPYVVFCLRFWFWNLVAFQKDTLRDATIFNSLLNNMHSIIIQVIVNDALSNSIIFIWVLNNWFLEESVELEYL